MSQDNNFILNKNQIEVFRVVHSQLILDGLAELELNRDVEKEVIGNAKKNFDLMITNAQKILTEMGINDEIRKEILAEENEEKLLSKKGKIITNQKNARRK